ncbi:MAG TPA: FAD-dependent oxidoreductase, partial [Pirellulaceae bacterium]|nr:FAD-dependent oxidoreductase [Pirellulaceae bacterium]
MSQRFSKLEANHSTEILIIGGGITGLSVALELLGRGHDVTVCEANVIGGGTTGGSSGHLDAHPEMGPRELISQ